jgi:hypothetical protein
MSEEYTPFGIVRGQPNSRMAVGTSQAMELPYTGWEKRKRDWLWRWFRIKLKPILFMVDVGPTTYVYFDAEGRPMPNWSDSKD